ncbi:hypothetical protein Pcinc_038690 [Petrolisthes cinctipes]|uniref:Uncharacterized protein n=1 Tax=Petrolisthes cinctipes TaxID=88211 RepID=A0AAE1BQI2_PETCI|nr:hypothetical protein Pcinc_038690 [Petrolisthes cinctipes]
MKRTKVEGMEWVPPDRRLGLDHHTGQLYYHAPFCTVWSHYYSCRRLTILGVALVSLGVFLCAFYRNLAWYYFCFGVLAGLGMALSVPQGFLLGQQYFKKRRTTANGLSMAGQSLGSMLFPPLINLLVENARNTHESTGKMTNKISNHKTENATTTTTTTNNNINEGLHRTDDPHELRRQIMARRRATHRKRTSSTRSVDEVFDLFDSTLSLEMHTRKEEQQQQQQRKRHHTFESENSSLEGEEDDMSVEPLVLCGVKFPRLQEIFS